MDGRRIADIDKLLSEGPPKPLSAKERKQHSRAKRSEEKKQQDRDRDRREKREKKNSEIKMSENNNTNNNDSKKRSAEDVLAEGASDMKVRQKARDNRFQGLHEAYEKQEEAFAKQNADRSALLGKLVEASERSDRIDEQEAIGFRLFAQELQYRRVQTPGPRQGGYDTPCSSAVSTPDSTASRRSTNSGAFAKLDASAAPRQLAFAGIGVPEEEEMPEENMQLRPFKTPVKKYVIVVNVITGTRQVYSVPNTTTAMVQVQTLTFILADGKMFPLLNGRVGEEMLVYGAKKGSPGADPILAIKGCGSQLAAFWSDYMRLFEFTRGDMYPVEGSGKQMYADINSLALLPSLGVVGFDKTLANPKMSASLLVGGDKTASTLPKLRIAAKVASSENLLILAYANISKSKKKIGDTTTMTTRVYIKKADKADKLVATKRFMENEIADVAATAQFGMALYGAGDNHGRVVYSFGYSEGAEDWSDLTSDIKAESIAAGDNYGLISSGGGQIHILETKKKSDDTVFLKQHDWDLTRLVDGEIDKIIQMDESDGNAAFLIDVVEDGESMEDTHNQANGEAEDAKLPAESTD